MKIANKIQLVTFFGIVLYLFSILGNHLMFQVDDIYDNSLGLVSKNYEKQGDKRNMVKKPFIGVNDNNIIQWDAVHYDVIRDKGYVITDGPKGDYLVAFFPLYPFISKIVSSTGYGLVALNLLMFAIGLCLLLFSFQKVSIWNLLIYLSLPSMVIFAIPYSEATFFLMTAIGLYGLLRERYAIFFLGFLLAAMTRPALSIVSVSIILLELLLFIAHKDYKVFLKSMSLKILPLAVGTVIIMIIQKMYGSRSWFSFVKVQTYWDHYLRVPEKVSDWSQEGFAIHIGILFGIFIPLLVAIAKFFFSQVEIAKIKELPPEKYVLWLSVLYVLGACSLVLLFQGGNLHGLFRFTLCTPFFAVLVFQGHRLLDGYSSRLRIVSIAMVIVMCLIFFHIVDYSKGINFQDTGFFIFIAASILFLLQERGTKKWKYCVFALLLINSIWTAYLFNMYLSDGWIFA